MIWEGKEISKKLIYSPKLKKLSLKTSSGLRLKPVLSKTKSKRLKIPKTSLLVLWIRELVQTSRIFSKQLRLIFKTQIMPWSSKNPRQEISSKSNKSLAMRINTLNLRSPKWASLSESFKKMNKRKPTLWLLKSKSWKLRLVSKTLSHPKILKSLPKPRKNWATLRTNPPLFKLRSTLHQLCNLSTRAATMKVASLIWRTQSIDPQRNVSQLKTILNSRTSNGRMSTLRPSNSFRRKLKTRIIHLV